MRKTLGLLTSLAKHEIVSRIFCLPGDLLLLLLTIQIPWPLALLLLLLPHQAHRRRGVTGGGQQSQRRQDDGGNPAMLPHILAQGDSGEEWEEEGRGNRLNIRRSPFLLPLPLPPPLP